MEYIEIAVEKAVRERKSVRTYEETKLSEEQKNKINKFIDNLNNPFGVNVNFYVTEKGLKKDGEKLGTYGVIKGATYFIGVSVKNTDLSLEAVGYEFENLILYITSLGLGSVWLAGTLNRDGFASALNIKEDEIFIAVSPVGYISDKKTLKENMMRKMIKADDRKQWDKMFFKDDFSGPLSKDDAGEYALPLEMVRLAPSAKNVQPWLILKKDNMYHFYVVYKGDNITEPSNAIKRTDLGIAMSHFHQMALELKLNGEFKKVEPKVQTPKNTQYLISWVCED